MKFLLLAPLAAIFVSCASTKPVAVFQAPSFAPVEQAVTRVEQHVSGAKDAARKLAAATDEASKKDKAWQDAYNQLNEQQDAAWLQIQSLKDELKAKDIEVKNVVAGANNQISEVVKERDRANAQIEPIKKSRHGWVMRFWMSSGIALAACAWITKRFWLPLVLELGSL